MSNTTSQFTGSIPYFYDHGLGPHIFAGYASDLATRMAKYAPRNVLEIAAGTGILTERLRTALPAAQLTATDLNPPMLDIARAKFAAGAPIQFKPADACALPFDDSTFDAAVCQFGVMFFPDKEQSYREAARVLKGGGRYLFNVWDAFEFNPFARIASDTIGSFFSSDPPGFYKTPFGYHDVATIEASLAAAGFNDISAEIVRREQEIPEVRRFAEGLVLGNPVIEEIRGRGTADPEYVIAAVTAALEAEFGSSPGRMPLQAIVVAARKA